MVNLTIVNQIGIKEFNDGQRHGHGTTSVGRGSMRILRTREDNSETTTSEADTTDIQVSRNKDSIVR